MRAPHLGLAKSMYYTTLSLTPLIWPFSVFLSSKMRCVFFIKLNVNS